MLLLDGCEIEVAAEALRRAGGRLRTAIGFVSMTGIADAEPTVEAALSK